MTGNHRKHISLIAILLAAYLFSACQPIPTPSPTVTGTPSPTATATVTPLPSPTSTLTPTPEPAWFQTLDPSYATLKASYALVKERWAKAYPSLQDAVINSPNYGYLPKEPAYVAFYTTESRDGHTFYGLYSGNWMREVDLEVVTPSGFAGILLAREIDFRFGWVLSETQSVDRAGIPIRTYPRYQVVHEFPAAGQKPGYIAIGADEWLPEQSLALVQPGIQKEAGEACRFMYVDIPRQTLSVFDGCKLVFATLISSGKNPLWTYSGSFAILYKADFTTIVPPTESISEYYLEGVPYFMTFYGDLGFHGAYWHDDFGAPVSHGCINLSPADARWLYEWASIGDRVIIIPPALP